MKAQIRIVGQLSGNFKLRQVCTSSDLIEETKFFNDIILKYPSKKAAIKALSDAYQYLKQDREDWIDSIGSYTRGIILFYDASSARFELS